MTASNTETTHSHWDKALLVIPAFLLAFGVMEVMTASRYVAVQLGKPDYYFWVIQLVMITIGLLAGFVAYVLPLGLLKRLITFVYFAFSGILLFLVLATFALNGANRWLFIGGTVFGFQPSEFMKIAMILYMAQFLTQVQKKEVATYKEHFKQILLPFLLWMGIPLLLIIIEPDLGTAVVIGVALAIMYLLRPNKHGRTDLLILGGVMAAVLVLFSLGVAYRFDRIKTYIPLITKGEVVDEFGSGYQIKNILIGVGSGGWFGQGLGRSRQRFGYLVETTPFTDSMAAVVFEELGFLLSILFIGLYYMYIRGVMYAAKNQQSLYERLVLWGLATCVLTQTLFHLAVNVALVPVKGIPLPFMSYGGSSLITMIIMAALILRFSRPLSETVAKTPHVSELSSRAATRPPNHQWIPLK